MSLSTWKKEFYSHSPSKAMTALQAADHSLLKWEGALPKNLTKHRLFDAGDLEMYCNEEGKYFTFEANNCSLCVKYFTEKWDSTADPCAKCPLVLSGCASCVENNSPFDRAARHGEIKPMVKALRETVVWILENDKK